VSRQGLRAEYDREKGADYRRFDGKEIATIRMLELELVAADLSRQMTSMHEMMRLISCETRQLARRVNGEGRQTVRTALSAQRLESSHNELAEKSSDDDDDEKYVREARMAVGVGEANISTQKALLSEVIGELKSVSVMMSSTLHLVTASSDRAARNTTTTTTTTTTDSHDRHLMCSPTVVSHDKDDDGYYYEQYDKNDDTYTTEVCKKCVFVRSQI